MVPQLSSAPPEYQSLVTTYLSGLSSAQAQALWQLFLAQENLTQNPTATQDPFYLEPFTLFVQSVVTNAPSNFQTVISSSLGGLPLAQQQQVWELFLQQEGLMTNPSASDSQALSDFKTFTQSLLVTAPPILQALAGAYLSNLSLAQQQQDWSQFLAQEHLTTNPQMTDADFSQVLNDFSSYVQNISANQQANLSPSEVQQNQLMLSVFQVMLLMLSTVENTQAMQQALEIYYGRGQDQYAQMMAQVPIYLNPPDLSQTTVNLTDLSKFTLGYDNISIQDIINYTLQTGNSFNLPAKNSALVTGVFGSSVDAVDQVSYFNFSPSSFTVNPGPATDFTTIQGTSEASIQSFLESQGTLNDTTLPFFSQTLATAIANSNTLGAVNPVTGASLFDAVDVSSTDPTTVFNALDAVYTSALSQVPFGGQPDPTVVSTLEAAAQAIATLNSQNSQYIVPHNFEAFHSTNVTAITNLFKTIITPAVYNTLSINDNGPLGGFLPSLYGAIAASNDPASSSYGSINIDSTDPTALGTSLINAYKAIAGSSADTAAENALQTVANALAPLNASAQAQFTLPLYSSTQSNVINQILTNLFGSTTLTSAEQSDLNALSGQIANSNNPNSQSAGTILLTSTNTTYLTTTLTNAYKNSGGTDQTFEQLLPTLATAIAAFNSANGSALPTTVSPSGGYTVTFYGPTNNTGGSQAIASINIANPAEATQAQIQATADQAFTQVYQNSAVQTAVNAPAINPVFTNTLSSSPVGIPWRYNEPKSGTDSNVAGGVTSDRASKNQELQQIVEQIKAKSDTLSNLQNAVQDDLSNDANITQAGASVLETVISTLQSILSSIFKQGSSTSSG